MASDIGREGGPGKMQLRGRKKKQFSQPLSQFQVAAMKNATNRLCGMSDLAIYRRAVRGNGFLCL